MSPVIPPHGEPSNEIPQSPLLSPEYDEAWRTVCEYLFPVELVRLATTSRRCLWLAREAPKPCASAHNQHSNDPLRRQQLDRTYSLRDIEGTRLAVHWPNMLFQFTPHPALRRRLVDVSPLHRLRNVSLWGCVSLTDVSPLANLHRVDLSWCCSVCDVSALGRVHTLILTSSAVQDVSALGLVHTLVLSKTAVSDVSSLTTNHRLLMCQCPKLRDVSPLKSVHTLDLRNNPELSDVSGLTDVNTLLLEGCSKVTDVSALVHVMKLDVRRTGVTDVTMLRPERVAHGKRIIGGVPIGCLLTSPPPNLST